MAPSANFVDLCRICATETQSIVRHFIFEGEGKLRDLSKKIAACLPVKVKEDDRLPKVLCGECVYKLDLLHEFREKSQKTEAYLFTLIDGPASDHHVRKQSSSQLRGAEEEDDDDSHGGGDNDGGHDIDDDDDELEPVTPAPVRRNAQGQICEPEVVIKVEEDNSKGDAAAASATSATPSAAAGAEDGGSPSKRPRRAAANKRPIREDSPSLEAPSSPPPPKRRGRKPKGVTPTSSAAAATSTATPGTSTSGAKKSERVRSTRQREKRKRRADAADVAPCIEAAIINAKPDMLLVEIKEERGTKKRQRGQICQYCNKRYYSSSKLKNHISQMHFQLFPCPKCSFSFNTKYLLDKHNVKAHKTKPKYFCCGKMFLYKSKLSEHIRTHKLNLQVFECDICKKVFTNKNGVYLHILKHICTNQCSICKKVFRNEENLKNHEANCLRRHAVYPCSDCNYMAQTLKELNTHFEGSHYAKYICSYCCKGFKVKHRLLDHERRHIGDCPFVCEYCGKAYHSKVSIQQHLKIHILPRNFECDICGKKFLRRSKLMDHKLLHFDYLKKHKCSFCDAAFHERTGLKNHLRTHTQEKPFECLVCNKHFSSNYSLKSHSNLHKDKKEVKRFPCTVCDKAFAKAAHLKRHSLIHTGERPHACEVCWHRFAQMSQLITHKVLKHKILPYECCKCGERFKIKSDMMAHMMDH